MPPAPLFAPSGVSAVDARWGGLSTGSTYVVVGTAADGRESLTLQMVRAVVDDRSRCLLLSPRDPAVLRAAARTVGLDLAEAHAGGRLRLVRMPSAASLGARGDDSLDRAFDDLAALVRSDRPDRVVIEDLGPLAAFEDADRLRAAILRLGEALRPIDATLVIGLGALEDETGSRRLAAAQAAANGTLQIVTDAGPRRLALSPHRDGPIAPTDAQPPTRPQAAQGPAAGAPEALAPAPQQPAASAPAPAPSVASAPAPVPSVLEAAPPADPPAPAVAPLSHASHVVPPSPPGAIPLTALSPPPDVDPALLNDPVDAFGLNTGASFIDQGFLLDSASGGVVGHVPSVEAAYAPPSPVTPAPAVVADRAAFRQVLDAAFASPSPFTVVAARMDPSSPHAAHFATVAGGFQAGMQATDRLFVDADRLRAVALVTGTADASALFATLQQRVHDLLGDRGATVLTAVGAAQIPNGAPFTDASGLLAYALDQ